MMLERLWGRWTTIFFQKSIRLLMVKHKNNMAKKKSEKLEPLEEIKRLLILGLINQGVKGKDVANVLEVDPAIISRIVSPKKS